MDIGQAVQQGLNTELMTGEEIAENTFAMIQTIEMANANLAMLRQELENRRNKKTVEDANPDG
jgi:hypothetical protein